MTKKTAKTTKPASPRTRPYGVNPDGSVNEAEYKVIRDMVWWTNDGKSPTEIAARLNAKGVPTQRGGKWYASTVTKILKANSYVQHFSKSKDSLFGLFEAGPALDMLVAAPQDKRATMARRRKR